MPINIPDRLPATQVLTGENIFVMGEQRASSQNIRPLNVLILNLMPKKIETEIQILRMLSNTPLQIDVDLLRIDNRVSKNTPEEHLNAFYRTFEEVEHKNYDGMIITGAPLGLVEWEDVVFWDRMKTIIDWANTHVNATLYLCWAAHAALYTLYGIDRHIRKSKISGVFQHQVRYHNHPLMRGFDDVFWVPHSRYAEINAAEIAAHNDLHVLADSQQAGVYLVASNDGRQLFVSGHPEYDPETLDNEFKRDVSQGLSPDVPKNYYHGDLPENGPLVRWRSHGNLLFSNWLNYFVYQTTPYDLSQLKPVADKAML
ncbi:homoserine O-acetyltransferase MetA [Echinimonas agarilytica]|uniref:Homoserine O-succinyltransferase n=1 Tax=Echinimonas agarilytica TaxID=1215918 RepID=A0AA41W7R2_9GAMM|nr:homoserine O-succinyltransferase [Echinimonas agarilytica]MCM2679968.1 homoserine O-succinyltransferase [Echinimonas agarilytica]